MSWGLKIVWLLPLVPLVALMVSDFRERRISVIWLAGFGACSITAGLIHSSVEALHNFLFNLGMMAGLAMMLLFYFFLRTGRLGAPLREQMGAGDPLFFLALAPLFAPRLFLQMMIVCLAMSLLWWLFNRSKTIPLVGTSGSVVAAYLIHNAL